MLLKLAALIWAKINIDVLSVFFCLTCLLFMKFTKNYLVRIYSYTVAEGHNYFNRLKGYMCLLGTRNGSPVSRCTAGSDTLRLSLDPPSSSCTQQEHYPDVQLSQILFGSLWTPHLPPVHRRNIIQMYSWVRYSSALSGPVRMKLNNRNFLIFNYSFFLYHTNFHLMLIIFIPVSIPIHTYIPCVGEVLPALILLS